MVMCVQNGYEILLKFAGNSRLAASLIYIKNKKVLLKQKIMKIEESASIGDI